LEGKEAMTSEKAKLRRMDWCLAGLVLILSICGCVDPNKIEQPSAELAPYPDKKVWAVVPFVNLSGDASVSGMDFATALIQQIQQIDGLDAIPVTRVIEAQKAAGFDPRSVLTETAARQLIRVLKVDGLITGEVTSWDPYTPPKIGARIRLYARPLTAGEAASKSKTGLDYRRLLTAANAAQVPGVGSGPRFVAQVSHHFDAANGGVLFRIKDYARGRVPIDSPSGWRRYLLSSDLFREFVSHELVRRLFDLEWDRQTAVGRSPRP
jgi:hypothetical protein